MSQVDNSYKKRIELEIGGYVEFECWKEEAYNDSRRVRL